MSEKVKSKKRGAGSKNPTAAAIIYVVAVVLLVLPITEWLGNAPREFGTSPELSFLNLPARLFALVGFVLMFYQFILGIRLPLLEKVFPRATNLKRHRMLGKVAFVLILLHAVMMLSYDYATFGQLLFERYRVIGMIAAACLVVGVVAAWFFKPLKLPTKAWRTLHLLGYVVFPLGFYHANSLGTEVITGEWTVQRPFTLFLIIYAVLLLYRIAIAVRTWSSGRTQPSG